MSRLADLTTSQTADLWLERSPTAVLVTGSTEQHGAHLPLDTDTYLAERVATAACERTGDLVLPSLPYGYNEKELSFPGTVSVPAASYLELLVGLGRSLRRSGWARMLIVNGHGWNSDLIRAAAHVLNEEPGFCAASCSYWSLCAAEVDQLRESARPGGMAHACEFETSMMLHLRPDSVRLELAEDEISYAVLPGMHHDLFEKSAISMPEPFAAMSKSGVIGQPTLATAEKGQVWFEAAVSRLADFLQQFSQHPPAHATLAAPEGSAL
jgi:creatinine amidohydrolase